jgi:hypothetical protein
MPVWQIGPKKRPEVDQQLLAVLVQEWKNPSSGEDAPIILEERDASGVLLSKVYVIWDRWRHLSGLERSELIMEACEQRYGTGMADEVLVAMGLTPEQSESMKCAWHKKPRGGTN